MIDPVSAALIAAAVAGATGGLTEVSKTAVVNASAALKAAMQKRFGYDHAVVKAVEAVDEKPTSSPRQAVLVEEVMDAGADRDEALLALADQLRQVLKEKVKTNATVQQIVTGNYNATSAYGDATVTVQPPKDL
jgi:hypothetical protein